MICARVLPRLTLGSSTRMQAELDFTQYYEVVAASLSNPIVGGSDTCVSTIKTAMDSVTKMLSTPVSTCAVCHRPPFLTAFSLPDRVDSAGQAVQHMRRPQHWLQA